MEVKCCRYSINLAGYPFKCFVKFRFKFPCLLNNNFAVYTFQLRSVFTPVSYTHLDVYKRQTDNNIFTNSVRESVIVKKIDYSYVKHNCV